MKVDCIKGVETFANTDIVDLENGKINITNELKLDIDQLPLINLEGQNKIRFAQVGMKIFIIFEDEENKMIFAYIIEQIINREKMQIKSIYTSTRPSEFNPLKSFFKYKKDFEMENLKERLKYVLLEIAVIPEKEKDYLINKINEYLESTEKNTEIIKEKTIAESLEPPKKVMKSELVKLPIEFNGELYETVGSFCNKFHIPNASFYDQYVRRKIPLKIIVERYKNGRVGGKSKTKKYEYLGKKMTIAELSELSGLKHYIIYNRLKSGWSVQEAVETPELKVGGKR